MAAKPLVIIQKIGEADVEHVLGEEGATCGILNAAVAGDLLVKGRYQNTGGIWALGINVANLQIAATLDGNTNWEATIPGGTFEENSTYRLVIDPASRSGVFADKCYSPVDITVGQPGV